MNLEKEIKRIEGLALHYYLEFVRYNQEEERSVCGADGSGPLW